jgi:hypothetical protein
MELFLRIRKGDSDVRALKVRSQNCEISRERIEICALRIEFPLRFSSPQKCDFFLFDFPRCRENAKPPLAFLRSETANRKNENPDNQRSEIQ